jgi:RNA polymerase sigma-70 factor (ECF subfamily)
MEPRAPARPSPEGDRSPVAAGDPRDEAIPRLLSEHGDRLYALGLRFCGDPEGAQDLLQETFLRAWSKWHTYRGDSSPQTWLYRIASRACQRLHRKRAGEPARLLSLDELLPTEGPMGQLPADADDPLRQRILAEARQGLEEAIVALPVTFRMPVILKEMLGLSVEETASVLGLKAATVKTRLHRARLRLRKVLEEGLPQEDVPPLAYDLRFCLDLLVSKQDALDRGVDLPLPAQVACRRCELMYESLQLTHDLCGELGGPDEATARRVRAALADVLGEVREGEV